MTVGIVLVTISSGHEDEVCKQLSKKKMIMEVNPLVGKFYDVVVKVKGNSFDEIGELIRKIRAIEGVIDTKTLLRALMMGKMRKKFGSRYTIFRIANLSS